MKQENLLRQLLFKTKADDKLCEEGAWVRSLSEVTGSYWLKTNFQTIEIVLEDIAAKSEHNHFLRSINTQLKVKKAKSMT